MSFQHRFDNLESPTCLATAPIVLRFASLFPRDQKRREMHDKQTGGDLTHIRTDLSHLNTQPIGEPDWIERLHAEEIAARERKGRFKEAEQLRERGPVEPWKFTRGGPLREGIITVNKRWFGGTGHESWNPERVDAFKQRATKFLTEHFPDGQLKEVNIDEDEEALHLHFVVAVWVEKISRNRGTQWLLQPSANPLFANYEHAQDLAGEAFVDLGIHRGERRAAAARQALEAGLELPEPRKHVPPSEWRWEQRRLALEDRDRIREKTRAEAAAAVDDGVALAKAAVKKTRKRAIKEAKARRVETDRQVTAAERDRARAVEQADAAQRAKLEAEAARIELDRLAEGARDEAARITQAAEDRAGLIVADATALATLTVRKSRKRSIAEAKTRREEADRAAAVAESRRADAEASAAAALAAREAAEAARLEADRQAEVARERSALIIGAAADRAAAIVSDSKLVGTKTLKKARKRASRETQGLRDEIRRMRVDAAIELRRGQLVAAFARRRTARLHEQANSLIRDIETKTNIWEYRERQHRQATLELAQIEQDRAAAQVAITQARDAATEIVAKAEARAEKARQSQDKADADRIEAERLAVSARVEAVRIQQVAEAEAEQVRADAARTAARAEVVAGGLAALTKEIAAGTLGLREDGRVHARSPDLLRPAYPEISPAVQAAATVAEQTRAARREADGVAQTTAEIRKEAEAEIARDKAAATVAIAQQRQVAQVELKKQREAMISELDAKGAELDRQEIEVKKHWAAATTLLNRCEPLLKKLIRWLSHPELPAEMKEEGTDIAAEALTMLGAVRLDDPEP